MGFVRCMGMSEDDIDEYLQPNKSVSYDVTSVGSTPQTINPDSGYKGLKKATVTLTNIPTPASLQSKEVSLSYSGQVYTPDSGHNGISSIKVNAPLQSKGNDIVPYEIEAGVKTSITPDTGKYGLSSVTILATGGEGSLYHNEVRCSQTSGVAGNNTSDTITCPGNGNAYFHTYNYNGDAQGKGTGILQRKRSGETEWTDVSSYKTNKTEWIGVRKGDIYRTKVTMTAESGLTGAFCAEIVVATYTA